MYSHLGDDRKQVVELLALSCEAVFETREDGSLHQLSGMGTEFSQSFVFLRDLVALATRVEANNFKVQIARRRRGSFTVSMPEGNLLRVVVDESAIPAIVGVHLQPAARTESSARIQRLVDALPVGIAEVSRSMVRINPPLSNLLRIDHDNLVTEEQFFSAIFGPKWHRKRKQALHHPELKQVVELKSITRYSRIVEIIAVQDGENELWVIQDVTDRVRSEERFKAVFDNSSDAYALVDETGIYECNEAAIRIFGVNDRSELIGRMPSEFSPEIQPDGWASSRKSSFVNELSRRQGYYRFEWIHRAVDGREFPAEVSLTLIPFGEKTIELAVWHDLTDRKANEIQLIQLAEELQLANVSLVQARDIALESARAKSSFLATMSHEIRTPLNGILGMTRLLLASPLLDEQRTFAETVQASGEMLLRVINDILDLSKIEAGKLSIDPCATDVATAVREVVKLFAGQSAEKQLRLEVEIDEDQPFWFVADAIRIKQVVGNLIGNAIKFTSDGGVYVRLSQQGEGANRHVRVEVRDTGIGIAPDRIGAIFESFTQADRSTHRAYGGTGLGLTICRRLVDLMDGSIGVVSDPGRGSTFWFELPLPVASPKTHSFVVPAHDGSYSGTEILLAEDNVVNVMVAKKHLERLGCSVTVAHDGQKAITMALAGKFDLVFMDMQMPGTDGIQAARAIRSREPLDRHLPIIALTANASVEDRIACIEAGMDDFITKPLMADALANMLRRYLPKDDDYLAALAA